MWGAGVCSSRKGSEVKEGDVAHLTGAKSLVITSHRRRLGDGIERSPGGAFRALDGLTSGTVVMDQMYGRNSILGRDQSKKTSPLTQVLDVSRRSSPQRNELRIWQIKK